LRIGLFGGTFNPVHIAHLIIAERARDELHLEKLIFMPCAIPPHKTRQKISSPSHRLDMLKLATRNHSHFEVSDLEISRGKVSFTVDTLQALRSMYSCSKEELFLIIGEDNVVEFHSWKNPDKILQLCRIVAVKRPKVNLSEKARVRHPDFIYIDAPLMDISSSDIRERVKNNKTITFLVPAAVEEYIVSHQLYRQS
jgi:nicotinate-nucleotide adenylyltransferase